MFSDDGNCIANGVAQYQIDGFVDLLDIRTVGYVIWLLYGGILIFYLNMLVT